MPCNRLAVVTAKVKGEIAALVGAKVEVHQMIAAEIAEALKTAATVTVAPGALRVSIPALSATFYVNEDGSVSGWISPTANRAARGAVDVTVAIIERAALRFGIARTVAAVKQAARVKSVQTVKGGATVLKVTL